MVDSSLMDNNIFYIICLNELQQWKKNQIKSMDLNATTEFRDHNIIIYIMKHSFIFSLLNITFNSNIKLFLLNYYYY